MIIFRDWDSLFKRTALKARKAPRLQGWCICCTVCLGKLRVSTKENYWPKMSPTQGSKWPSRCLDWVHFLWWRGSCIFYEDQYNHNLDQREGIEKVHQSASNKILFKLDLNQFSLQNFQNETCTTNIRAPIWNWMWIATCIGPLYFDTFLRSSNALFVCLFLEWVEHVFWHWCWREFPPWSGNIKDTWQCWLICSGVSWRKERLTELTNWNCDVHIVQLA